MFLTVRQVLCGLCEAWCWATAQLLLQPPEEQQGGARARLLPRAQEVPQPASLQQEATAQGDTHAVSGGALHPLTTGGNGLGQTDEPAGMTGAPLQDWKDWIEEAECKNCICLCVDTFAPPVLSAIPKQNKCAVIFLRFFSIVYFVTFFVTLFKKTEIFKIC